MRSGSTSGCCSSTSSAAGEVPEVLRERVGAGGDRVHEVEVAPVLVGRQPIGPFPEVAEVGRQHHVPELGEAMRVVAAVLLDRGRVLVAVEAAHLGLARTVTVLGEDGRPRFGAVVRHQEERGHRHRRLAVEHDRMHACTSLARRTRAPRGRAAPARASDRATLRGARDTAPATAAIACGSSTGHGSRGELLEVQHPIGPR